MCSHPVYLEIYKNAGLWSQMDLSQPEVGIFDTRSTQILCCCFSLNPFWETPEANFPVLGQSSLLQCDMRWPVGLWNPARQRTGLVHHSGVVVTAALGSTYRLMAWVSCKMANPELAPLLNLLSGSFYDAQTYYRWSWDGLKLRVNCYIGL